MPPKELLKAVPTAWCFGFKKSCDLRVAYRCLAEPPVQERGSAALASAAVLPGAALHLLQRQTGTAKHSATAFPAESWLHSLVAGLPPNLRQGQAIGWQMIEAPGEPIHPCLPRLVLTPLLLCGGPGKEPLKCRV